MLLLWVLACRLPESGGPGECGSLAFADADRDGHGDLATSTSGCDAPDDYVSTSDDCNDADAAVHPGADEHCNAIDDDCDGEIDVDAVDEPTWYADADGDGYGDDEHTVRGCVTPTGFVSIGGDCDVDDRDVSPGGIETCNEVDDDCDGLVDADDPTLADGSTWYADGDGDGYGDAGAPIVACAQPTNTVSDATDCDDGDDAVHPDAAEVCDLVDDDCDDLIDDEDDDVAAHSMFYADSDGDGYGDAASATLACILPAGFAANDDDCDDSSDTIGSPLTYYTDEDGDGWGTGASHATCTPASDDVPSTGDCRPFDATINPDAPEVCNEHDDNCDALVDDEDPLLVADVWYVDDDGDGSGDPAGMIATCDPPLGYVSSAGDCDDADATRYADAPEYCDGVDNDCDGVVDGAVVYVDWYADADGDGFGDESVSLNDCVAPSGYVAVALDCDDGDAAISPSGVEVCDGGTDEDCDGIVSDCIVAPDDADAILWRSLRYMGWSFPGSFGSWNATGDLDADGISELIVGDSEIGDEPALLYYLGSVFVVHGPVTGETDIEDVSVQLSGVANYEYFGSSVGVGDANDDLADDLVAGARGASAVYVFYGPVTAARDTSMADVVMSTSLWLEIGWDVDIGPDVDFDGAVDIVVGAPLDASGLGRVYVAPGASSGSLDLWTESTYVLGGLSDGYIGWANVNVGDVDGDGLDELAIGGYGDEGRVFLLAGGSPTGTYDVDDASFATLAGRTGEQIGSPTGVDYDDDGFSDVLAVAPGVESVYGILGPLSGDVDTSAASVSWSASEPDAFAGVWAVTTGDVDGDKQPDVLMGAYTAFDYNGVAYLQFGLASGSVDVGSLSTFSFGDRECGGGSVTMIPDWTGDDGAEIAIAVPNREDDATPGNGAIAIYHSEQLY